MNCYVTRGIADGAFFLTREIVILQDQGSENLLTPSVPTDGVSDHVHGGQLQLFQRDACRVVS